MKAEKRLRGPWSAWQLDRLDKVTIRDDARGSRAIATLAPPDYDIARLMAAAPELLAACEAASAHWSGTDSPTGALCRAAIAKALGK